ncbi:MAG: sialate O-acetylesterase [Prevotellaceae bacterium]|nr:sialate O-acetylesterase [Prevotellaceae bacterium]
MKYKLILLLTVICLYSILADAKVKLPAIFSDGMVLQREHPIKIWGAAEPGEEVTVKLKKVKCKVTADAEGKWRVELPAMKAGGPFELEINETKLSNILIGNLWLCSGQSNMELTVGRVTDMFAEEISTYENPMIRYVKTPYGNDLHEEKDDILRMDWKPLTKDNALSFSALAYFFAKEMFKETNVPVGIINSSWGGSSIEAWMSEDALRDFPRNLRERDIYNSDEYRDLCNKAENMMSGFWNTTLYRDDEGLHSSIAWYCSELDDSNWETVDMFSSALGTKNGYSVSGSHWFRQTVHLTPLQSDKDAVLRLGCMVDADSVFVNGTFVGTTSYQYPPRIYKVPASVLRPGGNTVSIRLISYGGRPSFVPDKPYCLIQNTDTIYLSRQWKYKLGCEMPGKKGGVSFQNIPTGMYNSMISPLRNLSFKGVLWYQGESNTGCPYEYESLLTAMIRDWHEKLADKNLPFFIVQLPDFMRSHNIPVESNWAALREAQRQVTLKVPNTALAVALGLGEWNDIHPLNKKELAKRISLLVKKMIYGHHEIVANGPICTSMVVEEGKVTLSFEDGTDDLFPVKQLKGFAVAGIDGVYHWAETTIENKKVVLSCQNVPFPTKVRYAWDDNPKDANLKNRAGLPAAPFQIELDK